jgi:hypothetical protein
MQDSCAPEGKGGQRKMNRPHSRKKTILEGTAEVIKGEKVEGTPSAAAGMEQAASGMQQEAEEEKQEEKKD